MRAGRELAGGGAGARARRAGKAQRLADWAMAAVLPATGDRGDRGETF